MIGYYYLTGMEWAVPRAPPLRASGPNSWEWSLGSRPATQPARRHARPWMRGSSREHRARPIAERARPVEWDAQDFPTQCPDRSPSRVQRPGTSEPHPWYCSPGLGAVKGTAEGLN